MSRWGRRAVREQEQVRYTEEEEEVEMECRHWVDEVHHRSCGKGHRSSLLVETPEGGAICLVCFSNLVSDPASPSHHVSYALSQISRGTSSAPAFFNSLRSCHGHLLVPPLVKALASFDDGALARQVIDLISDLCFPAAEDDSLARDFISRIVDRLLLRELGWSRRQIHMLHCLGLLLDRPHIGDLTTCIRDTAALVSNLLVGLQLPSEEIRGETLFVLYKLSLLQDMPWDYNDDGGGGNYNGEKLLRMSLETLLKTQSDDVRLNCIALLTVLARKQQFVASLENFSNSPSRELHNLEENGSILGIPSVNLFSDAIKGPLLSSDTQVQIGALDLIFHSFQSDMSQIKVLNEECVTDYVFEVLRLSGLQMVLNRKSEHG